MFRLFVGPLFYLDPPFWNWRVCVKFYLNFIDHNLTGTILNSYRKYWFRLDWLTAGKGFHDCFETFNRSLESI